MGNHCCIIGCLDQGSLAYTNGNNCIANGDPNEMIDGSGSGGTTMNQMDQTTNQRCIRPFTISRISSIQLPADSRLYRDQTLLKTDNGLDIVKKHISLNSLQSFIQNELSTDLVIRTTIDHSNIETNKVIQNFYITSFGGLSLKTLKTNHINLLLNATIDLPIVDFPKIMNNSINNNKEYLEHYFQFILGASEYISSLTYAGDKLVLDYLDFTDEHFYYTFQECNVSLSRIFSLAKNFRSPKTDEEYDRKVFSLETAVNEALSNYDNLFAQRFFEK